ncbi:hypothetical protein ABLV96_06145 [Staphylococcus equorum]
MNINIVTDLLKEENVVSIDLLLVTGKLERAKEIDVDKSSENLLFVTKPKNKVINLNHVVKIETKYLNLKVMSLFNNYLIQV